MAGSKVLQFFLLVSFVIYSMHALHVLLTDGKGKLCDTSNRFFKYETDIIVRADGQTRHYIGCVINNTYFTGPATIKVIVYIKSHKQMTRSALMLRCKDKRLRIAAKLSAYNYELLYLGVQGFNKGDERLIAQFLLRTIEPNPYLEDFKIDTIGEKRLNLTYPLPLYNLTQYQEEPHICEGNLLRELRSME